jgi:hypothetical protein
MRPALAAILFASLAAACGSAIANPALEGYSTFEAFRQRVEKLAAPNARVSSLGQTREKRDVLCITIGTGETEKHPATVIVGDVAPDEVIGSEIVVRMAEQLLARAAKDEAVAKLLEQRTFYFIPRPSPDAAERCFAKPFREPQGNGAPSDDDRDGKQGEDPPDDLNDDGWITMMRVEDVAGEYVVHPDDPRAMIRAELAKQERGKYKLLVEGRDNDGDEALNEDAGDGVSFNRNFTFQYPAFKTQAGPHQVSEPESRAVADFCFDHPNVAAVLTMTPEDNLLHPWKADGGKDKARIRTTILSDDAKYQDLLAQKYQKLRDGKGPPGSPDGEGSFSEWAYFHYGRWSWAARPWWIPPTEAKPAEGEAKEEKKSDEKRGAEDINALRYFDQQKIEGFVAWKAIEHPDFPGQTVEVGGFKPFYRAHPPIAEADALATKQVDFLLEAQALAPKMSLTKLKAESLGGGVVRVTATVVNEGFLPTHPEMGEVSQQIYPLQIAWDVPKETTWLQGSQRTRISRLAGQGGHVEKIWIVRMKEPLPKELSVSVAVPAVGSASATVTIK